VDRERSYEELLKLLEETEYKLEEANDTIDAIRSGEIDALIVNGDDGHQVFTLKSADHTFRIFIEQMTEGAITLNRDGIILYSNTSFASLVKTPLEKITGTSFIRFLSTEDQVEWNSILTSAWNHDVKIELYLFDAGNTPVPVVLSLKTLLLVDGLAMSVIITDLTAQREAQDLLQRKNAQLEEAELMARDLNTTLEKAVEERTKDLQQTLLDKNKIEQDLRSNQEQLARILETMAEGVVITDLKGDLTYANPMARKIMGIYFDLYSSSYMYNPDWKTYHIDGKIILKENYPVAIAMRSGDPVYDYEIAIQPGIAEKFYISVNAAPVMGEEGNIVGGIVTFMDVTNRRKAIQQKDDFISVASHELRTPVTSLKASLQLLEKLVDRPDSPMIPKLIMQANRSMNKMSTLIEDLLNAAKMTEGQLHLKQRQVNLKTLTEECTDNLNLAGFSLNILSPEIVMVYADPDKLEQVLTNFISNAAKYAAEANEATILIEEQDQQVKLSVTDKGPGIVAEKLPHIFERFYRVDSNGIQYSGLGLGLYISSQIIAKHGGKIGADSIEGNGSTFWFTLPKHFEHSTV
jgi:two-component system phosphate regulon sensor histidine kinase PhoR